MRATLTTLAIDSKILIACGNPTCEIDRLSLAAPPPYVHTYTRRGKIRAEGEERVKITALALVR
jgi:hypothetical protein